MARWGRGIERGAADAVVGQGGREDRWRADLGSGLELHAGGALPSIRGWRGTPGPPPRLPNPRFSVVSSGEGAVGSKIKFDLFGKIFGLVEDCRLVRSTVYKDQHSPDECDTNVEGSRIMKNQNRVPHYWVVWGLIVAFTCTGCRSSGWKMPGSGLFSWNRDPDPATLAGDASQDALTLPEGPANKYDPTAIASTGSSSATADAVAQATADAASAYGYTAANTSAPAAGTPAAANGYQTGPYQMSGFTNPTPSGAGQVQVPAPAAANTALPSPYGGSYPTAGTVPPAIASQPAVAPAAAGAAAADIPLPSSVSNALNQAAPAGLPAPQSPTGVVASPSPVIGNQALPPLPTETTPPDAGGVPRPGPALPDPGTVNMAGVPTYPSLPPVGALPPVAGAGAAASGPSAPGAGLPAVSSSLPAPSSALPPVHGNRPAGYAPGTTGRPTKYDFSTSGSASSGYALPPNTAAGSGSLLR